MAGRTARWLVAVALVEVVTCVAGCNVRELGEVIQRRFREEVAAQCASIGDKCSFDRQCCKGLECSMSASKEGVHLSCQRAWLADPDRGDMVWETEDSLPKEPRSDNGDWMVVKSEEAKEEEQESKSAEENSEKMYPTDMMTEIENLKKREELKILRENEELEKLFTEKEENELEQLKALREDAEMDELRRLKELRLKRKMQLIKELKELRGLKAEEGFINRQKYNKENNSSKTEDEPLNNYNQETPMEYYNNSSAVPAPQTESPDDALKPVEDEGESIQVKHKQGIHEVHHKRKHHHHKRKDTHETLNSTDMTNSDIKENVT